MNPLEQLITTIEQEIFSAHHPPQGIMANAAAGTDPLWHGINKLGEAPLKWLEQGAADGLNALFKDAGPLFVGVGLFALGSAMIVFSFGEDLAQALISSSASNAAGAAKALVGEL